MSSTANDAVISFVMMPSCTIRAIEAMRAKVGDELLVGLFLQQYEAQNRTNACLQAKQMTLPCFLLIQSSIPTFLLLYSLHKGSKRPAICHCEIICCV